MEDDEGFEDDLWRVGVGCVPWRVGWGRRFGGWGISGGDGRNRKASGDKHHRKSKPKEQGSNKNTNDPKNQLHTITRNPSPKANPSRLTVFLGSLKHPAKLLQISINAPSVVCVAAMMGSRYYEFR
jgi:hypothetical protein